MTDRSQEEATDTASIPDNYHGLLGNYNKNSHGSGSSENSGAGPHYQLKTSKDSGKRERELSDSVRLILVCYFAD